MLSSLQRTQFHENGYLILENYVSQQECLNLIRRMHKITEEFSRFPLQHTVFSTSTHQHQRDRYFLDSADRIHYFLEEGALDETGQLTRPFHLAINKVGHSLHRDDPVFRKFCQQSGIRNLAKELGYLQEPLAVQSMYIFKQPGIGAEVRPHQDSTFIHTSPERVLGIWLALEDASPENGCLRGLPGPGWTKDEAPGCRFIRKGDSCTFSSPTAPEWNEADFIPLSVSQGSLILFSGLFPHMSYANQSSKTRHAFTLHMIDKNSHYGEFNWIQASSLGFQKVSDAGPLTGRNDSVAF